MPKKQTVIRCVGVVTLVLALGIVFIVWRASVERAELADAKADLRRLVQLGQSLEDAERTLTDHGYALAYDEAIFPTAQEDYLQQLVIVGDTSISALDTFCYTVGIPNPLDVGSPYVVIEASPDGEIIRIR